MEIEPQWIIFPVAFVAVGYLAWRGHQAEKARRAAMAEFARHQGFRVVEGQGLADFQASLQRFELLNQGHSQRILNLFQGTRHGCALAVFEYQYRTGSGKNKTTHAQTVVALARKDTALPRFRLSAENVFHKLISVFGYQDIDFPDDPEFSQAFLLRGKDESAIRQLFSPAVRNEMVSHTGLVVEGDGSTLLVHRTGSRYLAPEEVMPLVETAERIFQLLSRSRTA